MKINTLVLILVIIVSNNTSMRGALYEIPTGKEGITCSVRSLSLHETEWLFFRDQAFRYTRDLMIWGAFKNDTEGALLYLSQRENKDFLKRLHELYEPVEVRIQNNSDVPVVIPRTNYIKSYGHAVVVAEELVKRYPNFKKHTVLASLYAAGLGLIGGLFAGMLGVCAVQCFKNYTNKFVGVGLAIGALAALIPMAIAASFAGRASALHKKYSRLRSLAPKLKTATGSIIPLTQGDLYTIPPKSTFIDTLILYRPHMNSVDVSGNPTSSGPELTVR